MEFSRCFGASKHNNGVVNKNQMQYSPVITYIKESARLAHCIRSKPKAGYMDIDQNA